MNRDTLYEFNSRTGRITINHDECLACESHACVKACKQYGSGILKIESGKPILSITREEAEKGGCVECLSCEYECWFKGRKAIVIDLPLTINL
ncbi:MAG: hypothetical protein QXO32_02890 [Candidatus Bathyarchaeia archaeon]